MCKNKIHNASTMDGETTSNINNELIHSTTLFIRQADVPNSFIRDDCPA